MPSVSDSLSIVIATYNENANISKLLPELLSSPFKPTIIIVDDNSPDDTASTVEDFIRKFPEQIQLIKRRAKLGYGSALVQGFKKAAALNFSMVISMDADFAHDPKEISNIVAHLKNHDMVIGSRYEDGIRSEKWSRFRLLLSYSSNVYIRSLLGYRIKDCTSGFRGYRSDILKKIPLEQLSSKGYSFLVELLEWIYPNHTIKEIPIVYRGRSHGSSKMSLAIIVESFFLPWIILSQRRAKKFSKRSVLNQ